MRYIIRDSNVIRKQVYFYLIKKIVQENNEITLENYTGGKALKLLVSAKSFAKGSSIKSTLSENGFENCTIDLYQNIDAKIEPFSKMRIAFNGKIIFYGYIYEYIDFTKVSNEERIQIKLKGLQEKLKRVSINQTYPALTSIKDIIKDICQIVANEHTDIIYLQQNIKATSTSAIPISLTIKNKTAYKILTTLCDLINARWYINENSEIIVEDIDLSIQNVLFEAKSNFQFNLDLENIRNNVYIKRQTASGTGETGWTIPIGFPMNNLTSIKIFGKHTYEFNVPEYFDDATCQLIGQKILDEYAFPKYQGELKKNKIDKNIKLGVHKLILKHDYYFADYSFLDDINEFAILNQTSETIQIDNNEMQSGSGCLKLTNFQTGNNVEIVINKKFSGYIKTLFFYAKRIGNNVKLQITIGNANEQKSFIFVITNNRYILYKIDMPQTTEIYDFLKIKILEAGLNDIIYLDNIYYKFWGNYIINPYAKKINYTISNKNAFMDIIYNREPERIENYLKTLNEKIEILNFITEKR